MGTSKLMGQSAGGKLQWASIPSRRSSNTKNRVEHHHWFAVRLRTVFMSSVVSLSSIEYWFRCMDLDGDGVLSMYELEYFYTEQASKMEVLGIETMVFEDCLCQV